MITLFIGIWLQPRNQATFSVCQLPASSLASTFYSLKLCLSSSFSFSLHLPSSFLILLPTPHPSSRKLFICSHHPLLQHTPLSPTPSLCLLISLGTEQQQTSAFFLHKKQTHTYKKISHTCMSTRLTIYIIYIYMYIYINTYRDLDTYTGFFHVDYLGITTSGCNNFNICLL